MKKYNPCFALPEESEERLKPKNKYKTFFRPAKYLIPLAIFTAILASGCEDTGAGDGTDSDPPSTSTDPATIIDAPSFKTPVSITGISSFSNYIFVPALADMDSDGDLDVLTGYKYYSGSSFDLSFKYFRNDSTTDLIFALSNELSNLPSRSVPNGFSSDAMSPLIPALFDNDGDKDLIYSENYDAYYPGTDKSRTKINGVVNSSNTFAAPANQMTDYHSYKAIALVDLDGDDDLDLALGSSYLSSYMSSITSRTNKISYLLNQGTDDFSDTTEIVLVGPDTSISNINQLPIPSFVDIDNDGDQDMFVVMYDTGTITFYLNEGSSTVPSFTAQASAFSALPTDKKYFPAFGDLDGDTDMDIIVGTDSGELLFIENTDIE